MKNQQIEIIFARKPRGVSKRIQSKTWSRWSHVAIIDGDYVIQAIGIPPVKLALVLLGIINNSTKLGGVKKTPLKEFLNSYKETRRAYIYGDIEIARQMIDVVMYDAWGIVGLFLNRRIDCDEKMTCAKMIWLCHSSTRDSFAHRATPQRILEISSDVRHEEVINYV